MQFRTILAASTALALVSAAPSAHAGDMYVSVFGGMNLLSDDSGVTTEETTSGHWSTDADTGFVLGGAIGTHLDKWAQGLKVELEVSYRRNDLGGVWSEPEESEILDNLLPRNISIQVFRGLLENAASEQGARMSAMDNATRNAGDMINKLSIKYNRQRQAQITKELIEIISGAEAL